MWFLRGSPTRIQTDITVESVQPGYQHTKLTFKIDATAESTTQDGLVWIALAYPWSPHRPDGSLILMDSATDVTADATVIGKTDVQITEKLRKLRNNPNVQLMNAQELCQWYLDDIGVMSFWVKLNQTYTISYKHKIAANSKLFVPDRLPTLVASKNPEIISKLTVVNDMGVQVPKHLQKMGKIGNSTVYEYKKWDWDEDTWLESDNWDSSDDGDSDGDGDGDAANTNNYQCA